MLVRQLLLAPSAHPRGQPHLSAASGLVRAGAWLHVIGDDEHHIGSLRCDQDAQCAPVQLHRILPGELPHDAGERKKRKADFEALVLLPASDQHPLGALLALGSGSRPNRQQGVVVGLDGAGLPTVPAQTIDLSGLYQPLRGDFRDLNIEGAFIDGPALCLLQRANKGNGRSACIRYPLAQVQDWISGLRKAPPAPESLAFYALGEAGGAPYGFTDGAGLPGGGWIFSAVAEDTADSYLDGACAGSAIGWVDRHGVMQRFETAEGSPKIEGIALAEGGRRLLMVTDADDPDRPAALLVLDL